MLHSDLGERWEPFAGLQPAAAWAHARPACSSLSFPHHMRLACCGSPFLPPGLLGLPPKDLQQPHVLNLKEHVWLSSLVTPHPGLLGFPPKDLQHRFLCTFKPVFYIRQRDYSKVGGWSFCTWLKAACNYKSWSVFLSLSPCVLTEPHLGSLLAVGGGRALHHQLQRRAVPRVSRPLAGHAAPGQRRLRLRGW